MIILTPLTFEGIIHAQHYKVGMSYICRHLIQVDQHVVSWLGCLWCWRCAALSLGGCLDLRTGMGSWASAFLDQVYTEHITFGLLLTF